MNPDADMDDEADKCQIEYKRACLDLFNETYSVDSIHGVVPIQPSPIPARSAVVSPLELF